MCTWSRNAPSDPSRSDGVPSHEGTWPESRPVERTHSLDFRGRSPAFRSEDGLPRTGRPTTDRSVPGVEPRTE